MWIKEGCGKDRLRGGGGKGEWKIEDVHQRQELSQNHNNDTNISNTTGIQVLLNFQ